MKTQRRKRIAVLAVLFCVLLAGGYFSSTGSSNFKFLDSSVSIAGQEQRQQITGRSIENKNVADGSSLRSDHSFTKVVRESRSVRTSNRIYFNSIFAVFFKIAVIPRMIFSAGMTAEKTISNFMSRMVRYIHDSDGKKEKYAFLSVHSI